MQLALSLTQPWATLLASGEKRIETRSWSTDYRGLLAIHASKGYPDWAQELARWEEPFVSALASLPTCGMPLPTGAIVGAAVLVDCIRIADESIRGLIAPREQAFGDYTLGRYAWVFERPVLFIHPIAARGALGLWRWNEPFDWGVRLKGGWRREERP